MEIEPYEDSVFYDAFGMRVWEKRHIKVSQILDDHQVKRVISSLYPLHFPNFLCYVLICLKRSVIWAVTMANLLEDLREMKLMT